MNCSELYLCFFLNIICDCKSRDETWQNYRTENLFLTPSLGNFSGTGSVDPRESRGR